MSVIKLENISKVYGFGESATMALDGVDLEIQKGEFVAIMGPSGSGKSTLMNIIGLLDKASTGTYTLSGKDVSGLSQREAARVRRENIGFIFQSFNLLPRLRAIENVALPLVYAGVPTVKRLKLSAQALKNVGLEDRQYYMPNQLSGGQVQRVAVARALVNKPAMLLADEPTGNLDTTSSKQIMELLADIHKGGNTVLMITHNPDLAAYAERTVVMVDGKIDSDTKTDNKASNDEKKSNKKDKKSKKSKDKK